MFKKCLFCLCLFLTASCIKVFPSGIQVLNTTVTTNDDKKTAQVKFSLTWDHSWRLDDGPKNWDAAWVFIKFRTIPGDNWSHAYISATVADHKIPSAAEIKVGLSPTVIGGSSTTAGIGAFIYRKQAGNGTVSYQDIELKWNFTQNGLSGGEQVEVCVLATEMVYIPTASFYLGDLASTGRFEYNNASSNGPFPIGNATSPNFSNNTYSLAATNSLLGSNSNGGTVKDDFYSGSSASSGAQGAFPTGWPNGYSAFYCMKYEITQGEYVQFLNKTLVSVKNASTYWTAQTTGRYAIVKKAGTGTGTVPAEYELSTAGAAYLPCNFLGTKDILAWMVWAGLRPMTEFEFEKTCRGTETVPSTATLRPQYAWGSVDNNNTLGFTNKGMSNEGPSNSEANCAFAPSSAGSNANMDGPMRSGGYATPVSSRVKAGAGFYGVMEMSGNLTERCVTFGIGGGYNVSTGGGRKYRGTHGNGEIGNGANPNLPADWPALNAAGLGFRGGSYLDLPALGRISDRTNINANDHTRKANYGGRGVRTAP